MAHRSLYRKYRPSTFEDVVGQSHIERTLRNAVAEGKVAHAYLFTGPRGTGKTTTARLLAKALLCERGPTPEPDGTCEQCAQIAEGNHPDVFELDAASHTGVEVVREQIISRVQFAAARGGYKLYIIDEVHMLSTSSFNALLKTLEEPPPHVVFILCTTHPHKVPETIHSRCQRFDFHRITTEEIADRLRYIAEAEGFKVDRGAFGLIAKHADGGMRDAITALEQITSFTGGEVTVDDVEGILGEVDAAQLFEVSGLIARRDIAGAFRWVASMAETGTDLAEFVRELTAHIRDLYIIVAVGETSGIVDRTDEDVALLRSQAAEFEGPERLVHVLDLLGELASEMRWSSDPRLSLEVALTRMARPQGEMTISALAERVEALERGFVAGAVAPAAAPSAAPAPQRPARPVAPARAPESKPVPVAPVASATPEPTPQPRPESEPEPVPVSEAAAPEPPCDPDPNVGGALSRASAKRSWPAVVAEVKKVKPTRATSFAGVEVDVDPDGETLVVEFAADQSFQLRLAEDPESRDLLGNALTKVFGHSMPFRYQLGRGAIRPEKQAAAAPVPSANPAHEPAAEAAVPVDVPAAPTPTPFQPDPPAFASTPGDELNSVLDFLGAEVVSVHDEDSDGEETP